MTYQDQIKCPHCQQTVELEVEIEGDDGYMNLCPIIILKRKGVIDCPNDHWNELQVNMAIERRLENEEQLER